MTDKAAAVAPAFDLECQGVSKRFDQFVAVDDISFQIPKGSFFSILGPSGCGKTTLLRMLAGFLQPDQGDILIKSKSVLNTPPNQRPVNMVFQHLALFPTMNVAENIAYGLKRRKTPKAQIETAVNDVLQRIGLPDAGQKNIDQLSGGQKQRIAIARCLVLNPDVLLLDEPLGALDLKLREQMKVELKQMQHQFNTTFVYITHDQSEALVMSDQVAVMNNGRFEQVGTPQALYYHPATPFVAGFVGDNNRWQGQVIEADQTQVTLQTPSGQHVRGRIAPDNQLQRGDQATLFIRPEAIRIDPQPLDHSLSGVVNTLLFDGARSQILVRLEDAHEINVALPQTGEFDHLKPGQPVHLSWNPQACLCFPTAGDA